MDEVETIREMCRAKKSELHWTFAEIEKVSGIPEKTVKNFFSDASKQPFLTTAGAICRALGVSLDAGCDIVVPPSTPDADHVIELLRHDKAAAERESARRDRDDKAKNRFIMGLLILLGMVLVALVPYLHMDINDPSFGLWRGGPSTIGAVVILALTAGVAANIYLFIDSRASRRKK